MTKKKEKPPLGLRPKHIANESRMVEIQEAVQRYMNARTPVPVEWIQEYNCLAHNKPLGPMAGIDTFIAPKAPWETDHDYTFRYNKRVFEINSQLSDEQNHLYYLPHFT
jgi:hypothetical protein